MLFVVDANVLIDFVEVDESLLTLAVRHLGPVYIPRDLLDEVTALDEAGCERLALAVVDGETEQLLEATAAGGALSYYDHLCFILARDHGWTLVTNDGRLRRECESHQVSVMWGLQMSLEVYLAGGLDRDSAVKLAEAVVASNRWIAESVLETFKERAPDRTRNRPMHGRDRGVSMVSVYHPPGGCADGGVLGRKLDIHTFSW